MRLPNWEVKFRKSVEEQRLRYGSIVEEAW